VGATRRVGRVVKEQQMSNGKSPALTESSPASDTNILRPLQSYLFEQYVQSRRS
jgi:hypothetical protein